MAFSLGGKWKGWPKQAGDWIRSQVQARVEAVGERIVQRARQLAPVDTGFLRSTIDWAVQGTGLETTVTIFVGAEYGIFQEFGTRKMSPHPYLRPAINELGSWWVRTEMDFAAPAGMGMGGVWHGLAAVRTPGHEGFVGPLRGGLTPRQQSHVRRILTPSLKKYNRGLSRHATLRVRHRGLR